VDSPLRDACLGIIGSVHVREADRKVRRKYIGEVGTYRKVGRVLVKTSCCFFATPRRSVFSLKLCANSIGLRAWLTHACRRRYQCLPIVCDRILFPKKCHMLHHALSAHVIQINHLLFDLHLRYMLSFRVFAALATHTASFSVCDAPLRLILVTEQKTLAF
jgi:hypothetical protein